MIEAGTTPRTIKRFAGKRLHDPATGAYLTLGDRAQDDGEFVVVEAHRSEDIPGAMLKQIIVELGRHG